MKIEHYVEFGERSSHIVWFLPIRKALQCRYNGTDSSRTRYPGALQCYKLTDHCSTKEHSLQRA